MKKEEIEKVIEELGEERFMDLLVYALEDYREEGRICTAKTAVKLMEETHHQIIDTTNNMNEMLSNGKPYEQLQYLTFEYYEPYYKELTELIKGLIKYDIYNCGDYCDEDNVDYEMIMLQHYLLTEYNIMLAV